MTQNNLFTSGSPIMDELFDFPNNPPQFHADDNVLSFFDDNASSLFDSMFGDSPAAVCKSSAKAIASLPVPTLTGVQAPIATPPLDSATSFDFASLTNNYLSVPPDQAARLLAAVEDKLVQAYPHLVPAVERLRASLRGAHAANALKKAAPPPSMTTPPTPFNFDFNTINKATAPSPATAVASSPYTPFLDAQQAFTPFMDSPLMSFDSAESLSVAWDNGSSTSGSPFGQLSMTTPPMPTLDGMFAKPKAKVGRKRKERPSDPVELLKELDLKRQKNTEAARRSRVRRLAELDVLQTSLKDVEMERDHAKQTVSSLEAELEHTKTLLAMANAQLAKAGLQPI